MRLMSVKGSLLAAIVLAGCASESPKAVEAEAGPEPVVVVRDDSGFRLQVDGRDFFVEGVNWDYRPRGTTYDYLLWEKPEDVIKTAVDREMKMLQEMGVNAIRLYRTRVDGEDKGITPEWVEYIHANYGIYSIINHVVGRYGVSVEGTWQPDTDYSDPAVQAQLTTEVREVVAKFKDTRGVLLWLLGNENNYGLTWSSAATENVPEEERGSMRARWLYRTLGLAAAAVKEVDTLRPVAIANGDLQYLDMIGEEIPDLDIFGANVYRGLTFTGAFAEVQERLGLPVLLTEFGSDAYNARTQSEDQYNQARFLLSNWEEIYREAAGMGHTGNSLGGLTFQWSDGWWKQDQSLNLDVHDTSASWANEAYGFDWVEGENNMNEEWWGVVAKGPTDENDQFDLYPRAAWFTLQQLHRFDPYADGASPEELMEVVSAIDLDADVQRARE